MRNEFTAIVEAAEEGGFFAYCSEVSGANGQGETTRQAIDNLAEAIELILEDRRADAFRGLPADALREIVHVG